MSPSKVPSLAGFVGTSTLLQAEESESARALRRTTKTTLGLTAYSFNLAAKHHRAVAGAVNFSDPLAFIQEAANLGASAVQIPFGICEAAQIWAIRDAAERLGIMLESTVSLPSNDLHLERFDAELRTLSELKVTVARTVLLPGRRFEQFTSILDYANAMRIATKALSDAERIARRQGVKLALENHKDQTTEERLALLEQFSSEQIGACLDVGNNLALLEDPVEVARAFAPWTLTVHFKDQGVREYEDGFLLADVPVGQGVINLPEVIKLVRAKKPEVMFQLEMITRDSLRVPIYNESYWRTLDAIAAPKLAATLTMLKGHSSQKEFPMISNLSPAEQVRVERANVERSLRSAAEQLS